MYIAKHLGTVDTKRYKMVQKTKQNNEVIVSFSYENCTFDTDNSNFDTILIIFYIYKYIKIYIIF